MTTDIERSLSLFSTPDSLIEIRALHCWDRSPEFKSTRSGYFDAQHLADAAQCAQALESAWNPTGIYLTMNPVNPSLLARSANRIKKAERQSATADAEIVARRWLLLDFDPPRPAGISSTSAELSDAQAQALDCVDWLSANGWPDPVIAMSGNGWHLLYRIDLPPESKLVEACLNAVAIHFPIVDTSTHNAGRITKLYGTHARKGDSTPDRPHRRSELLQIPEQVRTVSIDRIEWLASQAPEKNQPARAPMQGNSEPVDVEAYLRNRNIPVIKLDDWNGSKRWFIRCPKVDAHTSSNADSDCSIWQDPSGMVAAKCFHNSCGVHSWDDIKGYFGELKREDFPQPDYSGIDISGLYKSEPTPAPVAILPAEAEEEWIEDDEAEQKPYTDYGFPPECLRPPGLIADLVDHFVNTAKYPQPIHCLSAALCLMSLITGRRVQDLSRTRTNIMIAALGPTRSGKEWGRQRVKTILEQLQQDKLFEEKVASNAALHGFLKQAHSGLLMHDEFGDWLAAARSKNGVNTQPAQIITSMTKLFSSSQGRYKADRYAANDQQVVIDQPHLVFWGASTGEVFWRHVTPEYLAGGLMGRMMIFENDGYVMPRSMRNVDFTIPESILTRVAVWLKFAGVGDMPNWTNPTPVTVPHNNDAIERFEAHETSIAEKRIGESKLVAAMWSGTAEITAKLALLFACSRSWNPLQITLPDVELAITLSNYLTRRKLDLIDDHVAENATEDQLKRVLRIIKAEGVKGIKARDLTRATQWLKKTERREIIETLIDSHQVASKAVKTKGRDCLVYAYARYVNV